MKLPLVLTTDLARDLGNLTTAIPRGFQNECSTSVHKILTTISATLSLLGTVLIISTYFAWKDLRSTSRRILVFISIADFFIAGSYLFGTWFHTDSTSRCRAQSFVSSTASLWSFFWTAFLAIFMYITVAKKQRSKAEILLKVFHFIGWPVPLIIVGAALKEGVLGDGRDLFTSGWCWIDAYGSLPKKERYLWVLMTGKAWEVTAYILIFVFYFMLKFHIRKQVSLILLIKLRIQCSKHINDISLQTPKI